MHETCTVQGTLRFCCISLIVTKVVSGREWADHSGGHPDHCFWRRACSVQHHPDHCHQGGKEEQRQGEHIILRRNERAHVHICLLPLVRCVGWALRRCFASSDCRCVCMAWLLLAVAGSIRPDKTGWCRLRAWSTPRMIAPP